MATGMLRKNDRDGEGEGGALPPSLFKYCRSDEYQ